MYHMIVKKRVTSVFERLSKGDYEYTLSGVGTTIEHHFSGEHSLGGKRTSTRTMRLWFELDYFRICSSKCIQSRHPVAPGIPLLSLNGLIVPFPLTEKTM
jgi:hypothetical protein